MLAGRRPASMARAYSLDLRERVVAAVAADESCRKVAATFRVSVASVVKWSQRFRATGSAAARPMGGQRPYALAGERDWLLSRLAEKAQRGSWNMRQRPWRWRKNCTAKGASAGQGSGGECLTIPLYRHGAAMF